MFPTKEKRERSLGTRLFLKPYRCNSPKCAVTRNPQRPGPHGKTFRRAGSEFSRQLLEKQKLQFSYGMRERQMRNVFLKALRTKEVTGTTMLKALELRLDNAVFRLGFALSRSVARQLVGHGHIFVNKKRVSIPSYLVCVGDVISLRPGIAGKGPLRDIHESIKKYDPPAWLSLEKEKLEGIVVAAPDVSGLPFEIHLVVDFYSKTV
jgi:small subunit ribosomal protein S4